MVMSRRKPHSNRHKQLRGIFHNWREREYFRVHFNKKEGRWYGPIKAAELAVPEGGLVVGERKADGHRGQVQYLKKQKKDAVKFYQIPKGEKATKALAKKLIAKARRKQARLKRNRLRRESEEV
jgi:hypothetical protein